MSKLDKNRVDIEWDEDVFEFSVDAEQGGSSIASSPVRQDKVPADLGLPDTKETVGDSDELLMDPLFKLLSEPKLPAIEKADRARLQLQSPNRIHFYWSVKNNPHSVLNKALAGDSSSYMLVLRLRNLTSGTEQFVQAEPKGDWWFDVDADSLYQCEVGFYAPNRPYVRIAYSNELRTPRKTPSLRTDYTPSFTTTAGEFAETLEAAGYKRDAFEVAMAGDNPESAFRATRQSYKSLSGRDLLSSVVSDSDLRFVMLALAAGYSLEEIESQIDPTVFGAVKADLSGVTSEEALNALEDHFDIIAEEIEEFEEVGAKVFGASAVNFPRRIAKKRLPRSLVPKINEIIDRHGLTSAGPFRK